MRKHHNSKKGKLLILIAISMFLFFLTGCTQQGNNYSSNTIIIENYAFNPNSLTISLRTNVTWKNNDNVDHTVVSEGNFNSGILHNGQSFTFEFNQPGTYNYSCTIHPTMKGKIIVQ